MVGKKLVGPTKLFLAVDQLTFLDKRIKFLMSQLNNFVNINTCINYERN